MRLSLISENSSGVVAYHLSTEELLPQIFRQGLKPGGPPPRGGGLTPSGFGTYVFFVKESPSDDWALQTAYNMADWLGNDRPVLIQTVVSSDQLLIDEDALDDETSLVAGDLLFAGGWDFDKTAEQNKAEGDYDNTEALKHFPPGSVDELREWLNYGPGHNRKGSKETLINIIDKYQIRPQSMFKVYMGHYQVETARSTEPVLPVNKVWVLGKNHEWRLLLNARQLASQVTSWTQRGIYQ